ncbi:hypothetical protein KAW65_02330 [candidate division WOR-3 bacterium]|nr:hypothetical protein [candidate division WOR-3 bacterium]
MKRLAFLLFLAQVSVVGLTPQIMAKKSTPKFLRLRITETGKKATYVRINLPLSMSQYINVFLSGHIKEELENKELNLKELIVDAIAEAGDKIGKLLIIELNGTKLSAELVASKSVIKRTKKMGKLEWLALKVKKKKGKKVIVTTAQFPLTLADPMLRILRYFQTRPLLLQGVDENNERIQAFEKLVKETKKLRGIYKFMYIKDKKEEIDIYFK